MKIFSLHFLVMFSYLQVSGQNFYDVNTIQKIEITFTESNWDFKLDTAKAGAETYIMAKSVAINGVLFDSVGVKYKGNSTYNANQKKNPFHIELDTYKNQDYQGYTDVKLSNAPKDPTFLREVLSYSILRQYMDAPLSNYANVYVNGVLLGLYSNSESISKKFVSNHFYSKDNPFVKCNPIAGAGPGISSRPNLVYLGSDSSAYYSAYEMKSDYGWKQLIALCDTLKNNVSAIEKILDVDRALWMLAFDNVFVNLDSYIGGFAQNYYLYQDKNGRFNSVVWDLNESFGTFSSTGTINLQNTTSKQQMTHLLHINDAAWPLVQKLLSIPTYKRMYIAHMKTILAENFTNGSYLQTAKSLQNIINNAVNADPNKFFTYAQYQSNLISDVPSGMGSAPGIKLLMDGRDAWLSAQSDFNATTPKITEVTVSENAPNLNSSVKISAKITDASNVFLGFRFSKEKPFIKILMYDDGLHGDGIAGDKTFATSVTISGVFAEYYMYGENSNAGTFSPARAEHEFYTLYAKINRIQKGDLVINEFMADNTTTKTDANGQYDDWIELYNNTPNILNLDNLYLTDNYTTPLKWKFPDNLTIAPKSYLMVWADDDISQEGVHTTIKLSASGEKVMLSYADGYIVDSISFGAQSKDISFQRCPNGSGPFKVGSPSFGTENCLMSGNVDIYSQNVNIYPNPSFGQFYINNNTKIISELKVFNTIGYQLFKTENLSEDPILIDLTNHPPGIYFVLMNKSIIQKIQKQ